MKNNWKYEFKKRFSYPIYEVRSFRTEGNDDIDDGLESFIESLLADVRSESYTNGYRDGYDQQKKELIEQNKQRLLEYMKVQHKTENGIIYVPECELDQIL